MAVELLTADRIRMIMAISEANSFSEAAEKLGITRSAVSRQIHRIETDAGCKIFTRDTDGPVLTQEGEALLLFARAMSNISERAKRHFTHPRPQALLRFGVTEDMTRSCLTRVLAIFAEQFPAFGFLVTCDVSDRLYEGLRERRLDVILTSHLVSERRGERLRVLPLAWVGRTDLELPVADPVPLVLMLAPEVKRESALCALRDAGRPWRVLFESASLSAVEAAVEAGLGITALGAGTERHGVADIGARAGLPRLPEQAFYIDWRDCEHVTADEIAAFVDVVRDVVEQIRDPRDWPDPGLPSQSSSRSDGAA